MASETKLSERARYALTHMQEMELDGWRLAGDDISGWRWTQKAPSRVFHGFRSISELVEAGLVEEYAAGCYRTVEAPSDD